jgi:hypothetical protein
MAVVHKQPLQVYLEPTQLAALRTLARRRKVPVAELVRQGVDRLLAEVPPDEDPLWGIVGIAPAPMTDLSERHDDYLAGWEREEAR